MAIKERFYIPIISQNHVEAIARGMEWLRRRLKRDGASQGVLATHSKRALLAGSLADTLGERIGKALYENKVVAIEDSRLVVWTKVTGRRAYLQRPSPVLCVYVDDEQLSQIDAIDNVSAICLVFEDQFNQQWLSTWDPINLRTEVRDQRQQPMPNGIVQEALRSISGSINRWTGPRGHPSDRAACIWAFRRLKKARIHYDPDEIRRFLVAELGWSPSHADQLRDMARGILDGKRLKAESERWSPDIVQTWKNRATQRESDQG